MGSKDKLKRFAENETFSCLLQPATTELLGRDHPMKGRWNSDFFRNGNPIILELGCGKGEYTVALSSLRPDCNFIGIDIKGARLWKGAKYAQEKNIPNIAFIRTRIEFVGSLFAAGEISEIWITFADPQEKKARKRLTHPIFLSRYESFLRPGGIIHLKTDSRLLHRYTFEVASANSMTVLCRDEDIYSHGPVEPPLSIKTFYEASFLAKGIPITYLSFKLDGHRPLVEPDWDQTPFEQSYKTDTRNTIF